MSVKGWSRETCQRLALAFRKYGCGSWAVQASGPAIQHQRSEKFHTLEVRLIGRGLYVQIELSRASCNSENLKALRTCSYCCLAPQQEITRVSSKPATPETKEALASRGQQVVGPMKVVTLRRDPPRYRQPQVHQGLAARAPWFPQSGKRAICHLLVLMAFRTECGTRSLLSLRRVGPPAGDQGTLSNSVLAPQSP
jgi:hypothetical protein